MKKLLLPAMISGILLPNYTAHATDLEIFSQAKPSGDVIVTLMLDRSGSMDEFLDGNEKPNLSCPWGYREVSVTEEVPVNFSDGTTVSPRPTSKYSACGKKKWGQWTIDESTKKYTKGNTLKKYLVEMFANEDLLKNTSSKNYYIGMGLYSNDMNKGDYAGRMVVPANKLDIAQRKKLIRAINAMTFGGGTPMASALAEAGAYMMGTTAYVDNNGYEGFTTSANDTKTANKQKYKEPTASANSCGTGRGIYLMTDGRANRGYYDSNWLNARNFMNASLSPTSTMGGFGAVCEYEKYNKTYKYLDADGNEVEGIKTSLQGLGVQYGKEVSGWACLGEYAIMLRDKNKNPSGNSIVTAVAGFGDLFPNNVPKINIKTVKADGTTKIESVMDCMAMKNGRFVLSADERHLCVLGSKAFHFGKGGVYFPEDGKALAKSIVNFASSLDTDNKVKPISTGTFSIPPNPIDLGIPRLSAYLPMLEPAIGETRLWKGNLKKYKVEDGTVKGANHNVVEEDGSFKADTYDEWNTVVADQPDGGDMSKGGVLSNQLKHSETEFLPNRNLFVENKPAGGATTTCESDGLQFLKIDKASDNSGKPKNFDCLSSFYTAKYKSYLVNFLGYDAKESTTVEDGTTLKDGGSVLRFNKDFTTHGAALHSIPRLITTKAAISSDGSVAQQKDYILYGSFDGTLRVVDDATGYEAMTFIPKAMIKDQASYLRKDDETKYNRERYGIDAPWSVYTNYETDPPATASDSMVITAKNIIAAGGLRMGGSRYYALDLTGLGSTDFKPKMLYNIGSDYGVNGGAPGSGDFARMGQTWGKPSIGYVKTGQGCIVSTTPCPNGKETVEKTMVHFLPGGYDLAYEESNVTLGTTTAPKQGNAVYMVKVAEISDSQTTDASGNIVNTRTFDTTGVGTRMWWASSSATNSTAGSKLATKNDDMTNSIVSQVIPLDRDYDGLTDHIYYADLGGRVFRADIDNSGTTYRVTRVVKMLDVSNQLSSGTDTSAPRFYESPLVTFMRWRGQGTSRNRIVGIVSVGSGNRSRPLHDRKASDKPDRIYTYVDEDIARNDGLFTAGTTLITSNLTLSDLAKLSFSDKNTEIKTGSETVRQQMTKATGAKKGWYYDLKYWGKKTGTGTTAKYETDRTKEVDGLKIFNKLHAINKILFFTSFNPHSSASSGSSCSASIQGATQRDTLCLPYGSCEIKGETTKKYDPASAGQGIVSVNFGYKNLQPKYGNPDDPDECTENCDVDELLFGGISNVVAGCLKPGHPKYNPLMDCNSKRKYLFPMSWQER